MSITRSRRLDRNGAAYRLLKWIHGSTLPKSVVLGRLLGAERMVRHALWHWMKNQYVAQVMAGRCELGYGVAWDGDVPMIAGPGKISIGDRVRVGNRQTWVVGYPGYESARLVIGADSVVNYQTLISVAREVRIGRHCLIAGEVRIFDNNNHPVDPVRRRDRVPFGEAEVAPVIIDDNAWIGMRSFILKGVHVGHSAIVAAGSVVTADVPPLSIVAGNPARVVKKIEVHKP